MSFALIPRSLSLHKIKTFHKISTTTVSAEIWMYASFTWCWISENVWRTVNKFVKRDTSHNPSLNLGSQLLYVTNRVKSKKRPGHICPLVKQWVFESRMMSHLHKCYFCIHFYEGKDVVYNFNLSLPYFLLNSRHHNSALERNNVTRVSLPAGDWFVMLLLGVKYFYEQGNIKL